MKAEIRCREHHREEALLRRPRSGSPEAAVAPLGGYKDFKNSARAAFSPALRPRPKNEPRSGERFAWKASMLISAGVCRL
jgi:hypothetical protein